MADKLILNVNMIRKADRFVPKRCAVEKVIEVSGSEFKTFIENPMKRNYYLPAYKDLMGYYDDTYHGVLFINMENGDGLLVNSEGYDYARYSQHIPNARGIIQSHEQTKAVGYLIARMENCIDDRFEQNANEDKFEIPLADLMEEIDPGEIVVDYVSELLSDDPRTADFELTHNSIEVTKRDLIETRLYCPLRIEMESEDGGGYTEEICSANYIDYDDEINENIRKDINCDEGAVKRGLAAYLHNDHLNPKVYSIMPMVETRNGDLYGVAVIRSYGELDSAETIELESYITGQFADGWGESYEQHPVKLGEDEVYISFWNSDDGYFLKPESEVFPEQEINQTMGGIS